MLYKVTPMMTPAEPKKAEPKDANAPPREPRKRRKSAVFDADGHEVLITMMCLKCRQMKPLGMFGLRKMADGAIRNQPWCRTCRSGAGTKKKVEATEPAVLEAPGAEASAEVGASTPAAEPQVELAAAPADAVAH